MTSVKGDFRAENLPNIAFKEWAGVCRALAEGRQTVLLRKGGIAEDGGVFRPEHPEFWLYPTYVHQAEQGLKAGWEGGSADSGGSVAIRALARVECLAWVDRLEDCERLGEFHVWNDETIAKRFAYRKPGLWVLGVRIFVRENIWMLKSNPDHAGCKSWVPLDQSPPPSPIVPSLSDAEATSRKAELLSLLGPGAILTDDEPNR